MQNLKFPWIAYDTVYTLPSLVTEIGTNGKNTRKEVEDLLEDYCEQQIERNLGHQLSDLMLLSIKNSSYHITNTNTLGLVRNRIPSNVDYDKHQRFMSLFLYEMSLRFNQLVEDHKKYIIFDSTKQKYILDTGSFILLDIFQQKTSNIAIKTTKTMSWLEDNIPALAGPNYVDFVRDSALVELGEKIGVKIHTSNDPVQINVHVNGIPTYHTMPANETLYVATLNGLSNGDNSDSNARPATLTGVNGSSLVHTYTVTGPATNLQVTPNPDHLLNKDVTYQLTTTLQLFGVRSTPIQVPETTTELPDISVANGVTESVNIATLFRGTRLAITATSSDTTKATVQLNQSRSSLGVVARGVGTSTITVTATNESGSANATFVVTITAASGG